MTKLNVSAQLDIAFMSHMSEHHAMAVMMAAPVLIAGYHGDLYKLAAQIVKDQGEEIVQMRNWLETWYGLDRPLRMPQQLNQQEIAPNHALGLAQSPVRSALSHHTLV